MHCFVLDHSTCYSKLIFMFTNKNIFLYGFVILVVLIEARGEGDFKIFLSASYDLFQGKNIYQVLYNDWYHYYYSVLFAIFLYPLTFLPLYLAKAIWLLLNVFFVKRIWLVIENWLPIYLLDRKSKFVFIALSFLFIFRFLLDNFHLSQMTIFILYLTLEGLNYVFENKLVIGSLLLALGIDVKLLPIVFLAYLFYRNNWKACVYIIVFLSALSIVPILFIGIEHNNFLLLQRWSLINPFKTEHVLDTSERSFHSITTLLSVLLVEDCGDYHALNLKRNICNISLQKLSLIINAARLILIMCSLYFINSKPFRYPSSKIQTLYEISYICSIIPLIFPHQQHYAFFSYFQQ